MLAAGIALVLEAEAEWPPTDGLSVVELARAHRTATVAALPTVPTIARDIHAAAPATPGRSALGAGHAAAAAVHLIRARVHAHAVAAGLAITAGHAAPTAVPLVRAGVDAPAATARAAVGARHVGTALWTTIRPGTTRDASPHATRLHLAATRPTLAAVHGVFHEVEVFVDLVVAVVVLGVALLRWRGLGDTAQRVLAFDAGHHARAASLDVRLHHARLAPASHIVELAIAVVVCALVFARLGARLHATFAATEPPLFARPHAGLAAAYTERALGPRVAGHWALAASAFDRTGVFII